MTSSRYPYRRQRRVVYSAVDGDQTPPPTPRAQPLKVRCPSCGAEPGEPCHVIGDSTKLKPRHASRARMATRAGLVTRETKAPPAPKNSYAPCPDCGTILKWHGTRPNNHDCNPKENEHDRAAERDADLR